MGDVEIGAGASVWFGAVLRADEAKIQVGDGANIQDNVVIHCAQDLPTVIERNASVGHSAALEGCIVEQGAVVGMGATMLQRSRLGASTEPAPAEHTPLVTDGLAVPTNSDNIILKALAALEAAAGRDLPTRFHLHKRIPPGAGLGGASSDAATALRAAKTLHALTVDLTKIAPTIGAHVPFFLAAGR